MDPRDGKNKTGTFEDSDAEARLKAIYVGVGLMNSDGLSRARKSERATRCRVEDVEQS